MKSTLEKVGTKVILGAELSNFRKGYLARYLIHISPLTCAGPGALQRPRSAGGLLT